MAEQFRVMQRMSESLGTMAEHMKTTMERYQAMTHDHQMLRERDMEQDMDKIREHMNTMTQQMEETLQIMERLHKKLQIHK